jgi:hypothetical protein
VRSPTNTQLNSDEPIGRALQERLRSEPYTELLHHCSRYHQDSAMYPIIGQLIGRYRAG